ncbi:MAG: tRNA pseudouridine(55) synthase TruB, partial [Acidobacteriaceae bacterium]|nr:tRNA pseudouridine(55) synthase TruB [Acidobacteriaceae bacterium]
MNGLLVLDKPSGMTSHDAVAIVRRVAGEKSIGHLGTLDPMATGVLPLLLGRYTRLAQFFDQADKSYEGRIRFGFATDTFDCEGEATTAAQPLTLSLSELTRLAEHFRGEMDQMPPVYSAKKINGVPAHKLARAGAEVPVKPARIVIHDFRLLALADGEATFTMKVSAGGYVRSVAHELGQMAGCGAQLCALRRTQAGAFTLDQAITIDELKPLTP